MTNWNIPLSDLNFDAEELEAVRAVLDRRWLTMGEEVSAFESEFAAYLGTRHAVAVSSGTAALHLAFLAAGIGPEDEIIQPAVNFVAAANMTVALGAKPVFCDIVGLDEPTLDPAQIPRLATPRTRAVVVMHYGGSLCRMPEIQQACSRLGLKLVEDACHAVGAAAEDGRMAGDLGDMGCFSFFSNKNLAVGEGGMVTTRDDALQKKLRSLRSHGMTSLTWDRHHGHATGYDVREHGFNYRMDEIRAALGRVQLAKLDRANRRRRELVFLYREKLACLPGWRVPFAGMADPGACHLMTVLAPCASLRARASETLRDAGIQTSLHYPCVTGFSAFRAFASSGLERSREFSERVLTLPLYPSMSDGQVEAICSLLLSCR